MLLNDHGMLTHEVAFVDSLNRPWLVCKHGTRPSMAPGSLEVALLLLRNPDNKCIMPFGHPSGPPDTTTSIAKGQAVATIAPMLAESGAEVKTVTGVRSASAPACGFVASGKQTGRWSRRRHACHPAFLEIPNEGIGCNDP